MLGLATISFVLLLVVVYYIARPWLVPQVQADGIRAVELRDQRDRLAASLTDLDMEFSTGKLAVEDYETQRDGRERELVEAERELGELGEAAGDLPASADADPDDRFCRSCGTELSEVTPT